jgi:hypothetical protein
MLRRPGPPRRREEEAATTGLRPAYSPDLGTAATTGLRPTYSPDLDTATGSGLEEEATTNEEYRREESATSPRRTSLPGLDPAAMLRP